MSVIVEFSMFPTDKGDSVSSYVARIVKMLQESGISYQLTPMGSIFEVNEMPDALAVIAKAYRQLELDCGRVFATAKFDIRKGKSNRMERKIKAVEEKIGKVS
ncbi:MAG: MTH1187 family thiamine-binding protein, partial [Bacteroidota bacterium]